MTRFLLAVIFSLGLGLRLVGLGAWPVGFTWDEAALGYNAYSLLHTGRDEHGQVIPLVFKSFGDYKPGLYIYLSAPPVAIFGLTEFAVRLPSALFGGMASLLIFVLGRSLFSRRVGLAAALLLALNPWTIHFSRAAWEANVALTLTILAACLFLRRRFAASAVFFGLTFWTYQGAKLFTPLLISALASAHRKSLIGNLKSFIKPLLLLLLLIFPIIIGLGGQSGRLKVFSVFSYTRPAEAVQSILDQETNPAPGFLFSLFHSELFDQVRGITLRYLNHFSPRFLFFEGDWANPRQAVPFYGYLHLPEILTFMLGLAAILKLKTSSSKLVLWWLLLAPIPSAFSRDIISAVRSLPLSVPLVMISALGLARLSTKKILVLPFLLLLLLCTFYYLDLYFTHSARYTATGWLYPYRPLMTILRDHQANYDHIVISPKLGQPYIFTLFYLQVDPGDFQHQATMVPDPVGDVGEVTRWSKYEFRPIFWPQDRGRSSTLFIGDAFELPLADLQSTANLIYLGTVAPPDGSPVWQVVALP